MQRLTIPVETIQKAVEWRHFLHSIPELAYKELQTSAFVAEKLSGFGLSVEAGFAGTGVVASLTKGSSGRTIGLRADMDALPINETADLAYRSTRLGTMHACGHDGHMAMLLTTASLAEGIDFDGTVRFIFQPAEENEGGARRMIEDGILERLPVEAIYGLHNWPQLPPGEFVAGPGPIMAAFSIFDIEIRGRGAHGAMPHEGIDPIVAGCAVVSALQSVVSRNVSPLDTAVLSVTQIHAGDAYNVIPERAVIRGTGRWFSKDAGDKLEARLRTVANNIAAAHDCVATISYERRYPVTSNEALAAGTARLAAGRAGLRVIEAAPSMASEDFAFMLEAVPGAYGWIGSGKDGVNPGLHSPLFDFNDTIIPDGVAYWVRLIETELQD
ncbi:M20 aminoacylase family protein [Phyllobacterium bourgognense]|uniref:Hippurate hydrolase n=1 Tax=Phyllobacterium bourgognense TaxID=314236 RepID=A0A368YUK5_9HYPH|nr:M20 aminoacylase family protein [Phyllobacterium bourgognense]RCW81854.1 hippurate hydrolase [Phyllobacterium bourgognense]